MNIIIIIIIYYVWFFNYIVSAACNYELKFESDNVYQIGVGEGVNGPGLCYPGQNKISCVKSTRYPFRLLQVSHITK
jgi:hypothetical protein